LGSMGANHPLVLLRAAISMHKIVKTY
jgi:hypothetical protein